jgi:hypothetical protein
MGNTWNTGFREEVTMPIHFRKRMKFGPLVFNFGKSGFTSWGLQIGRWSWNSRTRAQRVDLPGPTSWSSH